MFGWFKKKPEPKPESAPAEVKAVGRSVSVNVGEVSRAAASPTENRRRISYIEQELKRHGASTDPRLDGLKRELRWRKALEA
jgi:hypothetical protein